MGRRSMRSGETIVEVIVSAMIFLMLMGVLQTAITFSGRAMDKSRKLRKDYTAMFQAIPDAPVTSSGTTKTYQFRAYNTEETVEGNLVFSIRAGLGYKDVPYRTEEGEEKTTRFYLFDGGGS